MAAFKLIILLLPAFVVSSDIRVTIHVDNDQPVNVRLSGSYDRYLTNQDRKLFQIRGSELKQGIYMLSGALPYYVEVGSPFSNEMHSKNSWDIVRRKVVPIESKIISKNVVEVKVNPSDTFANNDLTIVNEWDAALRQFMIGEHIGYGFLLVQGNFEINIKERTVAYAENFSNKGGYNSGLRVGSIGVIRFHGNQMYAKKMVLKIEIKYEVSLHGLVGCKYNENHEGSYHWGYDVNACLMAAFRPTKKYASEVITITFYYDEEFRA